MFHLKNVGSVFLATASHQMYCVNQAAMLTLIHNVTLGNENFDRELKEGIQPNGMCEPDEERVSDHGENALGHCKGKRGPPV